jgi:hypothetical protein
VRGSRRAIYVGRAFSEQGLVHKTLDFRHSCAKSSRGKNRHSRGPGKIWQMSITQTPDFKAKPNTNCPREPHVDAIHFASSCCYFNKTASLGLIHAALSTHENAIKRDAAKSRLVVNANHAMCVGTPCFLHESGVVDCSAAQGNHVTREILSF